MKLRALSRDLRGLVFFFGLVTSACGAEGAAPIAPSVSVDTPTRTNTPLVVDMLPGEAAVVQPTIIARLVFSEPMDPRSAACLSLSHTDGTALPAHVAWDTTHSVAALRPDAPLPVGEYVLVVDTCATSDSGAPVAQSYATGFRVAPIEYDKYD